MAIELTPPVRRRKDKRDMKVCTLYDDTRASYITATECYRNIARRMGIGLNTVIRILQDNNRI